MRLRCAVLPLAAVLLAGCAGVQVERSKNLSAAGIAYAQATAAVIDVAIDASIDASSERQLRTAPRSAVAGAEQQAARATQLKALDEELLKSSIRYITLKRSVSTVEAYFTALQQLADGSTAEATGSAVESLADRLNGLNQAMDKAEDGKPLVSEAKRGALAGLAKVVAKQAHGAALAKALERDAPVIGRTLVLQERVLAAAGDDIRANLTDAAERFYVDRVSGPYRRGELGPAWAADRRAYLRARALGATAESVASAQDAARQMQTAWERILSGEYSAKELTAMLKDTEDLLSAVNALRDANKKP
jgi:hypothetical protein